LHGTKLINRRRLALKKLLYNQPLVYDQFDPGFSLLLTRARKPDPCYKLLSAPDYTGVLQEAVGLIRELDTLMNNQARARENTFKVDKYFAGDNHEACLNLSTYDERQNLVLEIVLCRGIEDQRADYELVV
jgi:hypothetical protein